jgi:hypothetical protein
MWRPKLDIHRAFYIVTGIWVSVSVALVLAYVLYGTLK